jgi:vitamin B12 transporter
MSRQSPTTVVNVASDHAYNDQLTIFARIDNLFNEQQQLPIGFLHQGFW